MKTFARRILSWKAKVGTWTYVHAHETLLSIAVKAETYRQKEVEVEKDTDDWLLHNRKYERGTFDRKYGQSSNSAAREDEKSSGSIQPFSSNR